MSEFPLLPAEDCHKRNGAALLSLLLSHFRLFCSFVLSHPLYFSYLLFFSPYIFKILSFLSPLFVTTTLFLLALLLSTLQVHDTCSDSEFPQSHPSLLFSSYTNLGCVLRCEFDVRDEAFMSPEELEEYKKVFETCPPEDVSEIETGETCSATELTFVDKFCSHESIGTTYSVSEALWEEMNEEPVEIPASETDDLMNLEEEMVKSEKQVEEVKPLNDNLSSKDKGYNGEMPTTMESEVQKVGLDGDGNDENPVLPKLSHFLGKISVDDGGEKENEDSQKTKGEINLGSHGSMRKEKEWRRTLACKLFEERHNVADVDGGSGGGGGEGGERMDLLWEAYETQPETTPLRSEEKKIKKKKMKNIEEIYKDEARDDDDDDDDDVDIDDEQLCCLQALKFSTGKMHLGIARPNLLKRLKAFKCFGRFHIASKQSKKKT